MKAQASIRNSIESSMDKTEIAISNFYYNTDPYEFNDVSNSTIFDVVGYSYEIRIRPNCKFWRFGLRFAICKSSLELIQGG